MSNIGKYVNYDTTIVSTLNSKIVRLKIIQNRKSLIPCSKIELPVDRDTIQLGTVRNRPSIITKESLIVDSSYA